MSGPTDGAAGMSAQTDGTALGGFEQRLLVQLRDRVSEQARTLEPPRATARVPATRPRRRRVPRLSLPAAATLAALVTALLTLLPAATPTLAQAFPILDGPAHALPARFARALHARWRAGSGPSFDLRHAYTFHTPAGTGYVVIDRSSRWMCILVPGFSTAAAIGRCERVNLARRGQPPLTLRISAHRDRQEVVALLPRGAAASATSAGHRLRVVPDHGVLAIVSAGAVTVTTTVAGGRGSRVTYTP
jgi:hypothetical protein